MCPSPGGFFKCTTRIPNAQGFFNWVTRAPQLFVIKKDSFNENYSLEDYGINLVDKEGRITVDTLIWNGLAKKSGFETRDVISEFKIENLERPNKAIVYPFALLVLFGFGYLNYKRKTTS
ncbi:MAG: hypothetical protein DSY28_00975 [Alphaproteobacteria bacterium]|nr:MAG: hypothetical protein DSY28_00975 [Alphaproteobacteria bacterium]